MKVLEVKTNFSGILLGDVSPDFLKVILKSDLNSYVNTDVFTGERSNFLDLIYRPETPSSGLFLYLIF